MVRVILQRDLDVLDIDAGQFSADNDLLVALRVIGFRHEAAFGPALEIDARREALEQTVHLALQRGDGPKAAPPFG